MRETLAVLGWLSSLDHIWDTTPVASGPRGKRQRKPPEKSRANIVCLTGVIIGLLAIFVPWTWIRYVSPGGDIVFDTTLSVILSDSLDRHTLEALLSNLFDEGFLRAGLLFAVGTVAALFTPSAGLLQALGLALFYIEEMDREEVIDRLAMDQWLGIGFFLACASTALVLASLLMPAGVGYDDGAVPRKVRLRTFTGRPSKPYRSWPMRTVRKNGAWCFALVATLLLMGALVAAAGYPDDSDGPMTEVAGGVMLPYWFAPYLDLSDLSVVLIEGTDSVEWNTSTIQYTDGVCGAYVLGSRNLSGIILTLTIVDWRGDAALGRGDAVIVTATNGTSFAEGVEYTISMRNSVAYFPPPVAMKFVFEFREGTLTSERVIPPIYLLM